MYKKIIVYLPGYENNIYSLKKIPGVLSKMKKYVTLWSKLC